MKIWIWLPSRLKLPFARKPAECFAATADTQPADDKDSDLHRQLGHSTLSINRLFLQPNLLLAFVGATGRASI